MRDRLLPRLPASSVTVIAGRLPPRPEWRADAAGRAIRAQALGRVRRQDHPLTYRRQDRTTIGGHLQYLSNSSQDALGGTGRATD